jgi:hypothetical protein
MLKRSLEKPLSSVQTASLGSVCHYWRSGSRAEEEEVEQIKPLSSDALWYCNALVRVQYFIADMSIPAVQTPTPHGTFKEKGCDPFWNLDN